MEMKVTNENISVDKNEEIAIVEISKPKKILYFCDGEMEEEDLEEEVVEKEEEQQIDESQLAWAPWIACKAYRTGSKILAGCDYAGEKLASVLGITTSKYSSEIEEFKRSQEEKLKEEQESTGWEKKNLASEEIVDKEKF